MAISAQQLTIYLYSAHRAVIFAIAQLSCLFKLKLCLVVHTLPVFVNISKVYDAVTQYGPKLSSRLLLIFSQIFSQIYILQGSAATQLRCDVMSTVLTNLLPLFHRMCWQNILKIGRYLANIRTKVCGFLFWTTVCMHLSKIYVIKDIWIICR